MPIIKIFWLFQVYTLIKKYLFYGRNCDINLNANTPGQMKIFIWKHKYLFKNFKFVVS